MEGPAFQKRVKLFFLQPIRGAQAFFVSGCDIARRWLAFSACLGAFEGYQFLWHDETW